MAATKIPDFEQYRATAQLVDEVLRYAEAMRDYFANSCNPEAYRKPSSIAKIDRAIELLDSLRMTGDELEGWEVAIRESEQRAAAQREFERTTAQAAEFNRAAALRERAYQTQLEAEYGRPQNSGRSL